MALILNIIKARLSLKTLILIIAYFNTILHELSDHFPNSNSTHCKSPFPSFPRPPKLKILLLQFYWISLYFLRSSQNLHIQVSFGFQKWRTSLLSHTINNSCMVVNYNDEIIVLEPISRLAFYNLLAYYNALGNFF